MGPEACEDAMKKAPVSSTYLKLNPGSSVIQHVAR
jgi:hypothetical protein